MVVAVLGFWWLQWQDAPGAANRGDQAVATAPGEQDHQRAH
jgi:hypothetical protein